MMQYLEYDHKKIKWIGQSPVDQTFLIAPLSKTAPVMIFDNKGNLLKQASTAGYPSMFRQLPDLSGYYYTAGNAEVKSSRFAEYRSNGRYLLGPLFITDNNLDVVTTVDFLPTTYCSNIIGIHSHCNLVLGKNHYLIQYIAFNTVTIDGKETYVVNCGIQEQLNNKIIWEWNTIDEPSLYAESHFNNNFWDEIMVSKKCACDYAHMNSMVKTSDGKYIYISLKNIGIIKLDYNTKKIIWKIGKLCKDSLKIPEGKVMFAHQHDLRLVDDNTLYFWDNENACYTLISVVDNVVTKYETFSVEKNYKKANMGNVVKVADNIIDICYGLRHPLIPSVFMQPIMTEVDMKTGEVLVSLTMALGNEYEPLLNVMYQINRGVNVYEDE